MKTALIGALGAVASAAAAGRPALAGLGAVVVLLIGVLCWTLTDRDRTANLVAILGALRAPAPPAAPSGGASGSAGEGEEPPGPAVTA